MCYQEIWEREVISLSLILSGFWYLLSSTRCGNNTLAWLNLLTKSFIKKIHDKNSMSNIIIGNFYTHFRKGEIQPFNRLWPLRSAKYCLRQHCCSSEPYVQPFFKFTDESSGRGTPQRCPHQCLWVPRAGFRASWRGKAVLLGNGPSTVTVMIYSCGWISPVSSSLWTQLYSCLPPPCFDKDFMILIVWYEKVVNFIFAPGGYSGCLIALVPWEIANNDFLFPFCPLP